MHKKTYKQTKNKTKQPPTKNKQKKEHELKPDKINTSNILILFSQWTIKSYPPTWIEIENESLLGCLS